MNNCNCTAGMVVPPAPFNKATACEPNTDCGLRTILIPKTKGSDAKGQPYAPQPGAEQNTIVVYAATGAIYIYDKNGIPTNFTGSSITPLIEALTQQVEQATADVSSMQTALNGEITNRIAADQVLQNTINGLEAALATETTTRSSEVLALQDALNALKAEVNAMAGSNTERDERIAADENLQQQITALQTSTEGALKAGDLKTINGQSVVGAGDIEINVPGLNIVQTTGDSETEVMSQKAVTEALATAGAGITSAVLSSDGNNLNLETSGSTPGSSTVTFKTVNGNSLIGTGDIATSGGGSDPTQITETYHSDGAAHTRTGNLYVESDLITIPWNQGGSKTSGRVNFKKPFAYSPRVSIAVELSYPNFLSKLLVWPTLQYGVADVNTEGATYYIQYPEFPEGVAVPDNTTIKLHIIAVGIEASN